LTPASGVAYTAVVDVLTILGLGVLLFTLALVVLRSERRRRRWIILLVPVPLLVLIVRWAIYRQAWRETGLASALAAAALVLWWIAVGRRLPPPEDTIRVWTKDDPF
jgi:drug/metabolite transporter (DMT)-like permease